MSSAFKVGCIVLAAILIVGAYHVALIVFSIQTLEIRNLSDDPVEVQVYDHSWRVEPHAKSVFRFRSNKGDAAFILIDSETEMEIERAYYVTAHMPNCHTISVTADGQIEGEYHPSDYCHLTMW